MARTPVLANKNNYTIMVRTPTGEFRNLRPNAAVAGPGFEQYLESRTLVRMPDDYSGGAIVYETPATFATATPAAPAPAAPVSVVPALAMAPAVELEAPAVEPEPAAVAEPEPVTEDAPSVLDEVTEALTAGIPDVVEEAPAVELPPVAPAPEEAPVDFAKKYAGDSITVPSPGYLKQMSKAELIFLCGRIGLRSEGSRSNLINRLSPISGRTVDTKGE